jgi:hypothetical protein
MRVREENCNMVLLAAVTLFCAMVAVAADWWQGPKQTSAEFAAQTPVRVVGAPFVPNVNPSIRQ